MQCWYFSDLQIQVDNGKDVVWQVSNYCFVFGSIVFLQVVR